MKESTYWTICGVIAAIGIAALIGSGVTMEHYRAAAIEHGAAEYHPQTGAFTWKEGEADDEPMP